MKKNTKTQIQLNTNQKNNIIALKKISSLALQIIKMIEEDNDCYQILQQLKSLSGLLKKTQTRTMKCSLEQVWQSKEGDLSFDKVKEVEEIIKSFELFNK